MIYINSDSLGWFSRVHPPLLATRLQTEFTKMMAGFFGGEGFVLQRLTGQGDAFVKARCGGKVTYIHTHDG